jgi:pyrroloquinoline quinone (PQQ) biosynthesis protein C
MTSKTQSIESQLTGAVARAIADRQLLAHSFYRRWQAGELAVSEIADYAVQYRVFEAALPGLLRTIGEGFRASGWSQAADMVQRNLQDELGTPRSHLDLFDQFAASLPAPESPEIGPAAVHLVATYEALAAEAPDLALAALAAYEVQAAPIAETKGAGLRDRYGVDAKGTEFWDVHAEMEADHGAWAIEALAATAIDSARVGVAARQGADAWWAFLGERELQPAGVSRRKNDPARPV